MGKFDIVMGKFIFMCCFIFRILGILFVNQCVCLKKERPANSLAGAHFTKIGTYDLVDTGYDTLVTTYNLTDLENSLSNAKSYHRIKFDNETFRLQYNLDEIYKVCQKIRTDFLPYETFEIPENQLKSKLQQALGDSFVILSELISLSSKTFDERLRIKEKMSEAANPIYLYPNYVSNFEIAKEYISFTFRLEKIANNAVVISVIMAIPFVQRAELYHIDYVPRENPRTKTFELLKDQNLTKLVYAKREDSGTFYFINEIHKCEIINGIFLCDSSLLTRIQDNHQTCTTLLFKSNCTFETYDNCSRARETCLYEDLESDYKKFTHLGNNKFFVLLTKEENYTYKCDGFKDHEKGVLVFSESGDHLYTGTVEIDKNCTLETPSTLIYNKNGVFEISDVYIEEEDLDSDDGVLNWVFASIVIVLVIVIASICIFICVKKRLSEMKET